MTASGTNWKEEKLNLEKSSLVERRQNYFCKDKFVPITEIPTWNEYFEKNGKSFEEEEIVSDEAIQSFRSEHNMDDGDLNLADKVSLYRGDITKLEIDAIVNAANESLLGGGGVDGAIHRAAGKLLKSECSTLNGCEAGESKISCGYKLPAKNVIHTVGPRGEKPKLLKSAYETSLNLMLQHDLKTIAFPCISTGIFGYPQDNAANVALKTVRIFLIEHSDKVDRIIFCLFLESDVDIYETELQLYFPVKKSVGEPVEKPAKESTEEPTEGN
jgi:O-acetyl-ADP-ribose deacetylase (regulator of RNase III)